MPASEDAERSVAIRQLLSQTSGVFGDHFGDYGRGDGAIERFIGSCASLGVVHQPGETMSYCNAGYVLLGRVVEVLRGQPWHEVLRDHIALPLRWAQATRSACPRRRASAASPSDT